MPGLFVRACLGDELAPRLNVSAPAPSGRAVRRRMSEFTRASVRLASVSITFHPKAKKLEFKSTPNDSRDSQTLIYSVISWAKLRASSRGAGACASSQDRSGGLTRSLSGSACAELSPERVLERLRIDTGSQLD